MTGARISRTDAREVDTGAKSRDEEDSSGKVKDDSDQISQIYNRMIR
jgi:hypothetical protein